MKCNSCKRMTHHSPGSWTAVTEGRDDPYEYNYCGMGHWEGDFIDEEDMDNDYWDDCKDFQTRDAHI